jgi:acetyl/propionyl-CoA carboxylase alpha subunit
MGIFRSDAAPSLYKDEPGVRREAPFSSVLIANRGEIAVRIIRACHEMGMAAVAVYSDADAGAAHVRLADRAVRIGPPAPADSYLRIDAIVDAALATGAQAVHPGYGFLAERAELARAVEAAGLVFVGPSADSIDALGDKLHARRLAKDAGVTVVPGTLEPAAIQPDQLGAIVEAAAGIGYPLLVKAAAGGGGRGMRRVEGPNELPMALTEASREAESSFGSGSVYLEREIRPARHVEVQLLGDASGAIVAIGERDCSIQRRHQKLVEEAPAPGLTVEQRRALHDQAVRLGRAGGLRNAATCEFLVAPDGTTYFLEVNTRLQVEHGITELVAGIDLVREQLDLAAGRLLSQHALDAAARAAEPTSHAIEVRISAEDPGRDFAPTPGLVRHWVMPAGPGVRVDTAIQAGDRVPPEYDNLIAKVMVHAPDRDAAIDRLARALGETEVAGIQTTLPFHRFVATHAGFREAKLSTEWVAEHWNGPAAAEAAARLALIAAGLAGLEQPLAVPQVAATPDQANGSGRARASRQVAADASTWARLGREDAIDRWPT